MADSCQTQKPKMFSPVDSPSASSYLDLDRLPMSACWAHCSKRMPFPKYAPDAKRCHLKLGTVCKRGISKGRTDRLQACMYPHESLPIASPIGPHDNLCLLVSNMQQANSYKIFEGALFHLQNTPEPGRKRGAPFLILPFVFTSYRVPGVFLTQS